VVTGANPAEQANHDLRIEMNIAKPPKR